MATLIHADESTVSKEVKVLQEEYPKLLIRLEQPVVTEKEKFELLRDLSDVSDLSFRLEQYYKFHLIQAPTINGESLIGLSEKLSNKEMELLYN